jgi:hypothetical protein
VARQPARGDTRRPRNGRHRTGIEKVFPDLVVTGEDGVKRVVYEGLIGPLIEAVKELDNRLYAIEQKLQAE